MKLMQIIPTIAAIVIFSTAFSGEQNRSWLSRFWQNIPTIARKYTNPQRTIPAAPPVSPTARSASQLLQQFQNAVKTQYNEDGNKKEDLLQKIEVMRLKDQDANRDYITGKAATELVKDTVFKNMKSEDAYHLQQLLNTPDQQENVNRFLYRPLYENFITFDRDFSSDIDEIFSMSQENLIKKIAEKFFKTRLLHKKDSDYSKEQLAYATLFRTIVTTRKSINDIKQNKIIPENAYPKIDLFIDTVIQSHFDLDDPHRSMLKKELNVLIKQDLTSRLQNISKSRLLEKIESYFNQAFTPENPPYAAKSPLYAAIINAAVNDPKSLERNLSQFIEATVTNFIRQMPQYKDDIEQVRTEFNQLFRQDIAKKIEAYKQIPKENRKQY